MAKSNKDASSKKRKQPPTAPRQGTRKSSRGSSRPNPSQAQLLNFLLTKEAENLCRPDEEAKFLESHGDEKGLETYTSSVFTPFQELASAMVLSRPISHVLGLRAIRTLFSPPYKLKTASKIKDAGRDAVYQALCDAHTQHKAKTADQLALLADVILGKYTSPADKQGDHLGTVLSNQNVEEALAELTKDIKGFGTTGRDIFRRRIQWLYEAAFPFVDSRSSKGLRALGLPDEAGELVKVIEHHWSELDTRRMAPDTQDERKRRVFVVVLERVTGADLEGKVDEVLRMAVESD